MNTHAQQFKCLANLLALSEIAEVSLEIRMVYIDKIMLSEMSTTAKWIVMLELESRYIDCR